jgi:hypothetical protein
MMSRQLFGIQRINVLSAQSTVLHHVPGHITVRLATAHKLFLY